MEKTYVCCFTGHREILKEHFDVLPSVLTQALEGLISAGVSVFRAGGAIGFDTVAALTVLEIKQKYPQLTLELYLPCKNQTERWNDYSRDVYRHILSRADRVIYTSEKYTKGCMLKRNRCMADGADFCVCYCHKQSGGTAYTRNYAQSHGVKILNLISML